jgi:hypothetical protein
MHIPTLANVNWRGLASFAAIIGGTALDCVYGDGSVVGKTGGLLTSLFINVASADAATKWEDERRKPQYAAANHDLTRLVGQSIARALYECQADHAGRVWFDALARRAEESYVAICAHPSLAELYTEDLPRLFEAAATSGTQNIPLLTAPLRVEGTTRTVAYALVLFLRDQADQKPSAASKYEDAAEAAITQTLFPCIREMFKRAYEGHDRAFGALCLDIDGEILARLSTLLEQSARINKTVHALSDMHMTSLQKSDDLQKGVSVVIRSLQDINQLLVEGFSPSPWGAFVRAHTVGTLEVLMSTDSTAKNFVSVVRHDDRLVEQGARVQLRFKATHERYCAAFALTAGGWVCLDTSRPNTRVVAITDEYHVLPGPRDFCLMSDLGRTSFVILLLRSTTPELQSCLENHDSEFDAVRQHQLIRILDAIPSAEFSFLTAECVVVPRSVS